VSAYGKCTVSVHRDAVRGHLGHDVWIGGVTGNVDVVGESQLGASWLVVGGRVVLGTHERRAGHVSHGVVPEEQRVSEACVEELADVAFQHAEPTVAPFQIHVTETISAHVGKVHEAIIHSPVYVLQA
jgi:hypothetical protein